MTPWYFWDFAGLNFNLITHHDQLITSHSDPKRRQKAEMTTDVNRFHSQQMK